MCFCWECNRLSGLILLCITGLLGVLWVGASRQTQVFIYSAEGVQITCICVEFGGFVWNHPVLLEAVLLARFWEGICRQDGVKRQHWGQEMWFCFSGFVPESKGIFHGLLELSEEPSNSGNSLHTGILLPAAATTLLLHAISWEIISPYQEGNSEWNLTLKSDFPQLKLPFQKRNWRQHLVLRALCCAGRQQLPGEGFCAGVGELRCRVTSASGCRCSRRTSEQNFRGAVGTPFG